MAALSAAILDDDDGNDVFSIMVPVFEPPVLYFIELLYKLTTKIYIEPWNDCEYV